MAHEGDALGGAPRSVSGQSTVPYAIGEVPADLLHLRQRVEEDIRPQRIPLGVVLVVLLGLVERLERLHLRDDWGVE